MKKIIIILITLLSSLIFIWSFFVVTLTGKIVDKNGNSLPYVRISKINNTYYPIFWSIQSLSITNEEGEFKLKDIHIGELCLRFSYDMIKESNTHELILFEECGDVYHLDDKDIGIFTIDVKSALQDISSDTNMTNDFKVRDEYGELKNITIPIDKT